MTGTISSPKRPDSRAAAARWCERALYASSCSRVSPHARATSSALTPCGTRSGKRARTDGPNGSAPCRAEPIGTRLIDSTPAAIARS